MKLLNLVLFLIPLKFILSQSTTDQLFQYEKINEHLYKIEIDNNSLIASIGEDGVLLCDIAGEVDGPKLMKTIQNLGGNRIDYIINTHWHADHTDGNKYFGKEAIIIAHENVRSALSKDKYLKFWDEEHPAYPDYALPDILFNDRVNLHFNGEDIEIISLPNGHTDGDALVYFKQSNVLHVGDCIFSNGFPAIDFEMGGCVEGFADNLRRIIEMMPPDVRIIVGHGPDFTISDVKKYETMIRSSLKLVQDAMQKGMSAKEMQKQNLLKKWESYGNGFFTCDEWITMIYESLVNNK